jgi:hypothetical protein
MIGDWKDVAKILNNEEGTIVGKNVEDNVILQEWAAVAACSVCRNDLPSLYREEMRKSQLWNYTVLRKYPLC